MVKYIEDREKVYADLCKDKLYPCQRCKRKTDSQERIECAEKGCDKWQAWFRRTWCNIHEEYLEFRSGGQA